MYVCVKVLDLGITDSCELPCEGWRLNLGPLEKQPLLLTSEHLSSPSINILEKSLWCAWEPDTQ